MSSLSNYSLHASLITLAREGAGAACIRLGTTENIP